MSAPGPRWLIAAPMVVAISLLVGCAGSSGDGVAAPDASSGRVPDTVGAGPAPTDGGPTPTAGTGATVATAPTMSTSTSPPPTTSAPTTAPTPNRSHTGEVLGAACVDPAVLAAAAAAQIADVPVEDLRSVSCAGDWVTAWTNPGPAEADLLDPEVLLFHRSGGTWTVARLGEGEDCTSLGVPEDVQLQLDCF